MATKRKTNKATKAHRTKGLKKVKKLEATKPLIAGNHGGLGG